MGKRWVKNARCFLGNKQFQNKNWEGMLEKVSARLLKWKSLLPLMSYRGRVLVVNNWAASTLWHRLTVMEPPEELICKYRGHLWSFSGVENIGFVQQHSTCLCMKEVKVLWMCGVRSALSEYKQHRDSCIIRT